MHDAFVEALVGEVRKLRLGNGLDPGTTQGPLISRAAVERVRQQGAGALAGGNWGRRRAEACQTSL